MTTQDPNQVARWAVGHPEEVQLLNRFRDLMLCELTANNGKGNRPGWLQMDRKEAMGEIGWHLAKLQVAAKDYEQYRDGAKEAGGNMLPGPAELVCEYAADVANCALMTLDVLDLFPSTGGER